MWIWIDKECGCADGTITPQLINLMHIQVLYLRDKDVVMDYGALNDVDEREEDVIKFVDEEKARKFFEYLGERLLRKNA